MWNQMFALTSVLAFVSLTVSVSARQAQEDPAEFEVGAQPASFICEELTAEVKSGDWIREERYPGILAEYLIVSDPRGTCNHPDVASAADYEGSGSSCYTMTQIGGAEPALPMACTEHYDGDPRQGASVSSLKCTGWNHRVVATLDGGFHLLGADAERTTSRVSMGSSRKL